MTSERIDALLARIKETDGPPSGVPATGLQLLLDRGQGTALALQMFESAEDMAAGDRVFAAMDAGETPGTRTSVDMCEMKLDLSLQE